jgi:integrase/recombinase XerD
MTKLRRRMEEDLRLRNYSPATIKSYVGHVKNFSLFHHRSPDQMGAEEVRAYLLYLVDEKKLSPATVNQAHAGIRFLYVHVLGQPCEVGHVVYQKRKRKLPMVLSEQEVIRLLDAATNLRDRAILMTLYSGGLRLLELIRLNPKDIDSARMQIRIRDGKGGKERYVVLSKTLLAVLREYFLKFRPQRWLFYADRPDRPIPPRNIQRMLAATALRAGLKRQVNPHMLRHSFATHLLERGTSLPYIQELLGHKSIKTTMQYIRVSSKALSQVISPLDYLVVKTKS